MIVPILITGAVLFALYETRGPATMVRTGRHYEIGLPQIGQTAAATPQEIEVARLAVQQFGFRDVVHTKTTFENGQRLYWFKGTWTGADTELNPQSPVRAYEVLF